MQAGKLYLETKIQAISLIPVVGEAHNGRQETLEQRDSERSYLYMRFLAFLEWYQRYIQNIRH